MQVPHSVINILYLEFYRHAKLWNFMLWESGEGLGYTLLGQSVKVKWLVSTEQLQKFQNFTKARDTYVSTIELVYIVIGDSMQVQEKLGF
jgi:hypothetical protein